MGPPATAGASQRAFDSACAVLWGCQSDFGGFPVTSSPKTVKSKSVLHTKPALLARLESVWSEKWALGGRWTALKRLLHRRKRSFAAKTALRAILEAFP